MASVRAVQAGHRALCPVLVHTRSLLTVEMEVAVHTASHAQTTAGLARYRSRPTPRRLRVASPEQRLPFGDALQSGFATE